MAKRRSLEDAGYNNILVYNSDEDYYTGKSTKLPDITIVGKAANKKKGLYPVKYRYNPDKWISARTKQLTTDDVAKAYTAATVGLLPNYISAASNLVKGNVKRALSDAWLYNAEGGGNPNMNLGIVGFSAPEGSLFSSVSKAAKATSKEWTAAQDAALARGDMTEAQRLRDLHFAVKSSNSDASRILYSHSTDSKPFNVFDLERPTNYPQSNRNGRGVYLNQEISLDDYEDLVNLYRKNPVGGWGKNNMLLRVNFENPEIINSRLPYSKHPEGYVSVYDGIPGEAFVRDTRKIKSDVAVTYDDKGVRIPLGERDNFNINDIRYSWLAPFIGLGTLGTLYGASNKRNLENNGYK